MTDYQRRQFLTADGLTLVADVGGPSGAPVVVLLHGGGQTRHSWAGAMKMLVDSGYRVISFDARGHGDSDWSPTGDYDLEHRGGDLQTVLDGTQEPVAMVGASMGGMTSFYAVGHGLVPNARALVLVDIVLRPAAAGVAKIRNFMEGNSNGFGTVQEAADAVSSYNPTRPRPKDSSGLLKNLRRRADGRYYWHWDPRMLDIKPNPDTPDWTDELLAVSDKIRLPTLLIRGGQSDIVDDQGVTELQELVPQTIVRTVAGAGHMVAGDKNDAFNKNVLEFLADHLPV